MLGFGVWGLRFVVLYTPDPLSRGAEPPSRRADAASVVVEFSLPEDCPLICLKISSILEAWSWVSSRKYCKRGIRRSWFLTRAASSRLISQPISPIFFMAAG